MNLKNFLDQLVEHSLNNAAGDPSPAVVKQAGKPEFGHYQVNGVMGAAKRMGTNPRQLADQVVASMQESGSIEDIAELEVAGPGFINISLTPRFIEKSLATMLRDARLGNKADGETHPLGKRKYVVDYSSPNLAKEMHIGHLRSTSIGDATVRILEFLGHEVVRANHVGDWGSQFGSLLAYMSLLESEGKPLATELKDLEVFYQKASELMRSDELFAAQARQFVVKLQSGDEACRTLWQRFIDESITHCQAIYDLLNISLSREDVRAESSYNDDLANIVAELESLGLVEVSDGAKCVFLPEFIGKDDKPIPAIIEKSDGGYPYIATDLAAAKYRSKKLKVDEALYFVDRRQTLHLSQLYAIAKVAEFTNENQVFKQVPFGTILNKEGKPFKTRDGGAVKLRDVAEESISRALALVSERAIDIDEADRLEIAHVVGIGAIKYAELSKNRTTDYVFDWDTMLSFEGNTAPYLQYAYTRIQSIFKRASIQKDSLEVVFKLAEPAELKLAVKLLQYPEAVQGVVEDYQANVLCNYLFELAGLFMSFYELCPVLKAEDEIRTSRLQLCSLSARTLQHGLNLLGINTVEQM